jgi:hypothetical protein
MSWRTYVCKLLTFQISKVSDIRNCIDHGINLHLAEVYADPVELAPAPAIVPPVARITTFGFDCASSIKLAKTNTIVIAFLKFKKNSFMIELD